jgi:mRNA interferase MazF
MELKQYEVVLVNLDPTQGGEMKKTRPCVVISPNEMNRYLRTIIIAPLTTQSRDYPTRVEMLVQGKNAWMVLDQIRTIDRNRVIKKLGLISKEEVQMCKKVIRQMLVD